MGRERRRTERVQKRARCRVRFAKSDHDGVILDLSEGGLALICDTQLEVAATVQVELTDPRKPIRVSALVWHSRRARFQGKSQFVYGCIIESPGRDYLEFFRVAESSRQTPVESCRPTPAVPAVKVKPPIRVSPPRAPKPAPLAKEEEPHPYRLRLRHRTTPRTKTLTVGAVSEDDARTIAEESLGDQWELLEICAA